MIGLLCACTANGPDAVTPEQARSIAREAYIYANPLADGYRILYGAFVDQADPEYKAPWNQIRNFARVYTPDGITKAIRAET